LFSYIKNGNLSFIPSPFDGRGIRERDKGEGEGMQE